MVADVKVGSKVQINCMHRRSEPSVHVQRYMLFPFPHSCYEAHEAHSPVEMHSCLKLQTRLQAMLTTHDSSAHLGVQVVEQNSGEVPLSKAGENNHYELAFVLHPLCQPADRRQNTLMQCNTTSDAF